MNIFEKEVILRKYYENDKDNKPCEECFWVEDCCDMSPDGWYETDKSLRDRVKENMKRDEK